MRTLMRIPVVTLVMMLLGAFASQAQQSDWSAVADTETVEVMTEDEDGSLRVDWRHTEGEWRRSGA
jgi:hypothetical protein